MKHGLLALSIAATLTLGACKKEGTEAAASEAPPAVTSETASEPTPPAESAAEPSAEDRARAEQQAKLDYATMENDYLTDAKGQWAVSAKASSAFGDANTAPEDSQSGNTPWQSTGAPNGGTWTNNNQDIGFDWIELSYDRPVKATEVRAVTADEEAVESINKVELIDIEGKAHTVWSGLSDTKRDERGARTWFVRKFDATPYAVKAVKLTFANNVSSGYKQVDAVQLVGE